MSLRLPPFTAALRRPTAAALLLALLGLGATLLPACTGGTSTTRSTGSGADATADSAPRRALLWRASHQQAAEVHLLGTMHLADPRVTRLPAVAEDAFEEADAVWTELLSTSADQAALAQAGMSQDSDYSLYQELAPELATRLREHLLGIGKPPELLAPMRIWMAEVMLAMFEAEPYLGGEALDARLVSRARAEGKQVAALESVEEQIAALSTGTPEEQERRLALTLERIAEERAAGRDTMREQLDAYLAGDEARLWELASEVLDSDEELMLPWWEAVYTERNRHMAERIDDAARAAPGQVQLYAVGSMHLIGSPSVVGLLRKRGWTVQRVPAPAGD